MKYIRTKYEILSNSRPVIEDEDCVLTDQRGWIKKRSVVKQADNIEELFDAFVWQEMVFAKIENNCLIELSYEGLEIPIDAEMIKEGIYGGIWTEIGLIYQARMKGVLPNGEIDWEPLCLI